MKFQLSPKKWLRITSALVLSMLSVGVASAVTTVVTQSVTAQAIEFTEAHDPDSSEVCTSDYEDWADIPNMSITFTEGGLLSSQAVLVTPYIESASSYGLLRMLVDGSPTDGASNIWFTSSPIHRTFASTPLAPGSHTIKFQYKAANESTGEFCARSRTMTIVHR